MKEFKIVNGKKIHPYVGGVKKQTKNKHVVSQLNNVFNPPYTLNLLQDITDERDFSAANIPAKYSSEAMAATSILDYTNEMSSVKHQGNLGSCVAFAAAAMKEWQERHEHYEEIKEGKRDHRKGKEYDYSESWIYWNCKKIDNVKGEGTYIRSAMKVLNKIGVPTEKAWPYSDDKLNIGEPKRWASLISKWALIDSYYKIRTLAEAKKALLEDGPFILGVPCFYDFFYPVNGIIKDPKDGDTIYGGHAICCVGYDDEKKLLKFKNSWGTRWGRNGYGYVSYNYFNKYNWGSWASRDISVTKEMVKESRSLL